MKTLHEAAPEPVTGGALGMEETHPSFVAGFKAGHAAGRKRSESFVPAQPVPLTAAQIDKAFRDFKMPPDATLVAVYQAFARAIERAHGIGK